MATAKQTKPAAKAAKPKTTAVANWDEELARRALAAKKVASHIGGGSRNVLSFKGGKLSYQGGAVPGNKLEVVVLSAINENNFYPGRYDPNSPASPLCYAFGSPDGDDENMGPHEEVKKDGNSQSETGRCADCPNNEWGSADTGRGKACKNVVSMAMIDASALEKPDELAKAEVFYAKLPVTSGKNWRGLVQSLGDRHFLEYVVELEVVPSGETYTVELQAVRPVDRKLIGAIIDLSDKEDKKWGQPYPKFEEPPARGPARKTVPIKNAKFARPVAKPTARR